MAVWNYQRFNAFILNFYMKKVNFIDLSEQNLNGKVWAMPTDTIPGLSCLALDRKAVARMDTIKKRVPGKSYIIMIGSIDQLGEFGIEPSEKHRDFLGTVWPGPVSVVVPKIGQEFCHLDGTIEGLAFRLPDNEVLRELCLKQGPLISTSANISGQSSMTDMDDIVKVFRSQIEYVVYEDWPLGSPSTLIKILR